MVNSKTVSLAAILTVFYTAASAQVYKVGAIAAPGGVSQLAYSSSNNQLLIRNSASAIKVMDLSSSRVVFTEMANAVFTDMSLSPSGQVLYATDYAGEDIGYGNPLGQHYVHRYDLRSGKWSTQTTSAVAGRIETVDDQRFVLHATDQWADFGVKQWGVNGAVANVGNVVSWQVFSGDLQYDATHGRVVHGSSGISSPELTAYKLTGNVLTRQESSGVYGAAYLPGAGNAALLSSDDSYVYYGSLQFDVLDVHALLRVFPEQIRGADARYAYGASNYYDQETGELVGSLGGNFSSFAFSRSSADFWAFETETRQLVHFATAVPETSTTIMMMLGLLAVGGLARRRT